MGNEGRRKWQEEQRLKQEPTATAAAKPAETKGEVKAVEPDVPYFPGHPTKKAVDPATGAPAYPAWVANTAYAIAFSIKPVVPNGYYYTAAQGGRSGVVEPLFPLQVGAVVSDGNVVWRNAGAAK